MAGLPGDRPLSAALQRYWEHGAESTFPDSTFSVGALAADAALEVSLDAELGLRVELF
jgi:hypothetical protein